MATCRSIARQPLAPLVDLLRGFTKREIQSIIVEVMPIITAPNLRKDQSIDQLADYIRSSGSLADVCKLSLKGLRKEYLHMILRQYDPKASQKMPKSAMIDRFIQLNDESLRDDGPCLATVPYTADCGDRAADFSNQMVDFEKSNRKMRKTKRNMIKKWTKGARLLCRKFLSKAIVAELKTCLWPRSKLMQWTVASLRDHVASVVGRSLHGGQALMFFNRKLQELLPKRRPKKKEEIIHKDFAVPKANFKVIADPTQWREMMSMRRLDYDAP